MRQRIGKIISIVATTILLTLSPLSHARPSINVGLSYGFGKISLDGKKFNDGSLGSSVQIDPDTTAWNTYMELNFSRYLRMEINRDESGVARMNGFSDGSIGYWANGPVSANYSFTAIKVGAVGLLPLGADDRFRLLGKLGLARWINEIDLKNTTNINNRTDMNDGISPYFGVGAELDLSERFSLRLQHERYTVSTKIDIFANEYKFDYRSTTMGLLYRF